ncbi:amino acid ABC transporter permease [Rhodoferax sp.]|uniref:amino acid ABC transporter permease n=1 Tax=Rhodoferax sp. TaxID=50421 RepID=UPI002730DAB8|nr:ABC transporter permease subunit [Rhodoferax sp.]MDP1529463.1 ABC transporter permease subunit [Rhodoferax sp.]MDP1943950.1 ABC transporter permease subunit [Rhodoferax sp.]MDP2441691.1 ABC transporter permease subunit [Rhodoferax sp.]MDP3190617.1 ABC transporter permease subunit [Rhodoferax sp.]MDP3337681.1 ABC transporter permease subunit [Rhodoferax sp.]
MTPQTPPKKNNWSWRSQAFRGLIYQLIAITAIAGVAWFLAHNTLENMRVRGIQSGFDFLNQAAGFDIGESLYPFDSGEPYWRAFLVGVTNTLRVAVLGIILATILGTLLGVGRFSRNALVRGLCLAYVEFFRNIPVLLQLLMWYVILTEVLPAATDAWTVGPLFLSKGGLNYPIPVWGTGQLWAAYGLLPGLLLGWAYRRWAVRQFEATGQARSMVLLPLLIVLLASVAGWALGGAPTDFNRPFKGDFSIENGGALTPEFLAVLMGLTLYTAAFIAEVVRGGISSVARGQGEAASALGLNRKQEMRLVMLPQALRVIIPPLTNQYLNLTKNSSLAVAIGYPDVVSIANTALNQTGRAVECIAIVMLVYLITSLGTSLLMNWYNSRAAIKER